MSSGATHSTRLIYDPCAYRQDLKQSTDPLAYQLYAGKYYNCDGCRPEGGKFTDNPLVLVDIESELKLLNRINTNCNNFKHPFCETGNCIGTFDPNLPPYTTPWACERDIVPNNIKKMTHPGYVLPDENQCQQGYPPVNYYSKYQ
jgi:hypothetical protein